MKDQQLNNPILTGLGWTRGLPVFVGVCAIAITLLLWQHEKERENDHLESKIKLKARMAQSEVLSKLVPQIHGLIRMARRFGVRKDIPRDEWEKEAGIYVEHFPAYKAIAWADTTGYTRWIVPLSGTGELQGMDLFSEKRPKTSWEMTKRKAEVGISPVIDLKDGEKTSFVYIPIFDETGVSKGHIVGVFSIKKLWDYILADETFHGASITLYEDRQRIYQQANDKYAVESLASEVFVNFYGVSWRMQVKPLRQWMDEQSFSTSPGILFYGAMMAFLLPLALYFAQVSRRHAALAESANRELAEQIDTRKKTEIALTDSQERYRNIVSLIPDIVYRLDTHGCFTYISPSSVNFGFDPESLIGKHFVEIVHPEDMDVARYRFDEKRTGDRATRRAEFRVLLPTGVARECELSEVTIHLSSVGLYEAREKPAFVGTQGIIRDITAQKQAREALRKANDELELRVRERTQSLLDLNRDLQNEIRERKTTSMALQESEARLRSILDNAPVMIYLKDLQGHYCRVNRNFEAFLRISEEDILGKTDRDLFLTETATKLSINDDMVINAETSREFEEVFSMPNGRRTCFSIKYPLHDVLGNIYAISGISMDITDRKRAEIIDLRFKRIVENSFNEIYIFDVMTLRFIQVSRGACENLGYSLEELLNMTPLDIKPEYTREKFESLLLPLNIGEKTLLLFETVHKRKDGTFYPVEVRLQLSVAEIPQVYLAIIQDITERKRAEDSLRKSHRELAYAQKMAHMGNWVWDIEHNELHWSDEIYRIFGVTPQQFGATYDAFLERVHPDDRAHVVKSVDESLHQRKPYSIDHRIVLPDGSCRIVHEQAEVVYNDEVGNPSLMRGTVQDITEEHLIKSELEKSREQLRELYAHLELVREEERTRIAREVHDELGQMLTALKIDLAWTQKYIQPHEAPVAGKIKSMLALLDGTILAVQRITAQLRPQILDILGLVATIEWETSEFQKRTGIQTWLNMEKNITIDKQRSTDFYRIIQEALTNVARHAEASNVHVILKDRGDHILLEVRDDGKGIAPEQIANLKSFGLTGIRERSLQYKGEVFFQSSMGKGTTLSVRFPKSV